MKGKSTFVAVLIITVWISFYSAVGSAKPRSGQAVWYVRTAKMITASRYEPRGSVLLVTNPETGKSIKVTVTDRGPWSGNRVLDLSTGAFKALYGSLGRGVAPVQYKVLKRGKG